MMIYKNRSRLTIGITLVFLVVPACGMTAAAATLNQKILPLNCVFETVNDGTSTVNYLTPAECSIAVEQPPSGSAGSSTVSGNIAGRGGLGVYTNSVPPTFFVSGTANRQKSAYLPWGPLATADLRQSDGLATTAKPHLSGRTAVVATFIGVATLIGLALLLV